MSDEISKFPEQEKALNAINKRKQFLLSEIGEAKLAETITALETICDEQHLRLSQLSDVIQYRQWVDGLPSLKQKKIDPFQGLAFQGPAVSKEKFMAAYESYVKRCSKN